MSYPEAEIVQQGVAAWRRLQQSQRTVWTDWVRIGHAIVILRKDALLEAKTFKPYGKIYTRAMAASLRASGLDEIGQQVRWRLLKCLEHEAEITLWLASLSDQQRMKFCHPDTVWAHFSAEFAPGRAVQRRERVTKNRDHLGSLPAHPDQDTIRRIAAELGPLLPPGTDVFKISLAAYHAVRRPAPPKPARRTADAELEIHA